MLALLFPSEHGDTLAAGFDYYEPLTTPRLVASSVVHSILAARLGRTDAAWGFFQRALEIDLDAGAGGASEGIHIANCGGIWQAVVMGFAGMSWGVRVRGAAVRAAPSPPLEIAPVPPALEREGVRRENRPRGYRGERGTLVNNIMYGSSLDSLFVLKNARSRQGLQLRPLRRATTTGWMSSRGRRRTSRTCGAKGSSGTSGPPSGSAPPGSRPEPAPAQGGPAHVLGRGKGTQRRGSHRGLLRHGPRAVAGTSSSAPLQMSPQDGKAFNCWFPMPFASARAGSR